MADCENRGGFSVPMANSKPAAILRLLSMYLRKFVGSLQPTVPTRSRIALEPLWLAWFNVRPINSHERGWVTRWSMGTGDCKRACLRVVQAVRHARAGTRIVRRTKLRSLIPFLFLTSFPLSPTQSSSEFESFYDIDKRTFVEFVT